MKKMFAPALVLLFATGSMNALAAGNIEAGKALAEKYNCASCHGADFNSPIDPAYPKLAGQHADYLEHALVAYKRGNKKTNGRNNAIMSGMSAPLKTKDARDLAAYINSLPGTLVIQK